MSQGFARRGSPHLAGSQARAGSQPSPVEAGPLLDLAAAARAALLVGGLGLAVALRAEIAGSGGGTSGRADTAFAAAGVALALLAGWRPRLVPAWTAAQRLAIGLGGALAVCAWPVLQRAGGGPHPVLVVAPGRSAAFAGFVVATLIVVTGEEVLLRGALWDACTAALRGQAGEWLAIGMGAVAFALIHVPWYGWGILPVDLAVGVWLGALRLASRGLIAPWSAHAGADLVTWWLL